MQPADAGEYAESLPGNRIVRVQATLPSALMTAFYRGQLRFLGKILHRISVRMTSFGLIAAANGSGVACADIGAAHCPGPP